MRYSTHIDYLIASTLYLGTQSYWWARTPSQMANELSLDKEKLKEVFESFPDIFRKSLKPAVSGEFMYSLQARYAQRDHKGKPDQRNSHIPPLDTGQVHLLHDFILKSAEDERSGRRALIGFGILILASVLSAMAVIYSATFRPAAFPPPAFEVKIVAPLPESAVNSTARDNAKAQRVHDNVEERRAHDEPEASNPPSARPLDLYGVAYGAIALAIGWSVVAIMRRKIAVASLPKTAVSIGPLIALAVSVLAWIKPALAVELSDPLQNLLAVILTVAAGLVSTIVGAGYLLRGRRWVSHVVLVILLSLAAIPFAFASIRSPIVARLAAAEGPERTYVIILLGLGAVGMLMATFVSGWLAWKEDPSRQIESAAGWVQRVKAMSS